MRQLILLSIVALTSNLAIAQWKQTNGPYGGTAITCLATSGNNIFAGTRYGLFVSTNNGSSWNATGLTSYVLSLAIKDSNILAGTNGGIYLSTNNGSTWTKVYHKEPYSFAISGNNIVATRFDYSGYSYSSVKENGNIFLSTDNGNTWTDVGQGLPIISNTYPRDNSIFYFYESIWSVAINGANIFIGFGGGHGINYSNDNGSTFTSVNNGFPSNKYNINSLTISGNNIFAGTDCGIYLSSNNGSNWIAMNKGLTNLDVHTIAVNGSCVFAGTSGGVFLSTDTGKTWTAINNGMTEYVTSLVFNGANIFAGTGRWDTRGGVYLSTDTGKTWTTVNNGLPAEDVFSLATSGNNIFAGTKRAAFLSTDSGNSWTAMDNGLKDKQINSLVVNGTTVFAGTSGGVFLSSDTGKSWNTIGLTNRYVNSLAINGNNIFTGTYSGGIFLSTDTGKNWTPVNNGLPIWATKINDTTKVKDTIYPTIKSIAISGNNIFAGTYTRGVFLSTNNGKSWNAVNNGMPYSIPEITALSISGTNIFAGTDYDGLFLSTDTGKNWTRKLYSNTILSLAIKDTNIFVGKEDYWIVRSTDNGNSWTLANNGFANKNSIYSLAISGSNIFAGTEFGVWKCPLSEMLCSNPSVTPNTATIICKGDSVQLTAIPKGAGITALQWSNGANTKNITVSAAGNYSVIVTDSNNCSATSAVTTVKVYKPTISQIEDTLTSSIGSSYQWNLNNNPIKGATSQNYVVKTNGTYSVTTTDSNGCSNTSDSLNVVIIGIEEQSQDVKITVSPNPTKGKFTIIVDDVKGKIGDEKLTVYNVLGEKVYSEKVSISSQHVTLNIELETTLPAGIYFLQINTGEQIINRKLVLEK